MRYLGGHLGTAVSALVDGQLDPHSADRAWAHVHGCSHCSRQVEREGWVKRRLASMSDGGPALPPADLLGSLRGLSGPHSATADAPLNDPLGGPPNDLGDSLNDPLGNPRAATAAGWRAVEEIERRERGRRRTGLAVVGAGSFSAAVLGFASLTGAPVAISGVPTTPAPGPVARPSTAPTSTATIASTAHVHGRLPRAVPGGDRSGGSGVPGVSSGSGQDIGSRGLQR